jgi:hypothetical protein
LNAVVSAAERSVARVGDSVFKKAFGTPAWPTGKDEVNYETKEGNEPIKERKLLSIFLGCRIGAAFR